MNWDVNVVKRVLKEIKRISKKDAERILLILEELKDGPYYGNIMKIKGEENVWRKRVGDFRILYEVVPKKKHINIFQAVRRTTVTYRKKH